MILHIFAELVHRGQPGAHEPQDTIASSSLTALISSVDGHSPEYQPTMTIERVRK